MRQAILRENLCVDANHQLHINVPADMGDEFEVIVLPLRAKAVEGTLSDDEQFMLAAYSAVIENDADENAVWEKYVRT
jgi:hypothetical protein